MKQDGRTTAVLLRASAAIATGMTMATACSTSASTTQPKVTDVSVLPAASQVVYQVVTVNGSTTRRAWEVLTQTSPFDVSDLFYGSDPRSGVAPSSGTVSSFDHLYDLAGGRLTLVSDRQPGVGSGVDAIAVELAELRDRGLAELVGRSSAAGNVCQLARLAEPPVGPIRPPDASGHDDICIDRSGAVVREAWTYHGTLAFRRTAVEVRDGPPDPGIQGAPPVSGAQRSAAPAILSVSRLAGPSYLAVPPTPTGFNTQPAVATIAHAPTDPTQVTDTSTIWSFSAGGAVITVEAGDGQLPWGAGDANVDMPNLNALGPASSVLRSDGPEIRFQLGQSRWIRVRGTVPPERLALYASELRLAGP